MSTKGIKALRADRGTPHRASFAVYAAMTAFGVASLIHVFEWYHVVTLVVAVGTMAGVVAETMRPRGVSALYVFTWITGILLGGFGAAALVMV